MSGQLLSLPRFAAIDANGKPFPGGKLYTYEPGTTTAKSAYTTAALSVAHSNPITLDADGQATVYLSGRYKMNLLKADGSQVPGWPVDEVGLKVGDEFSTTASDPGTGAQTLSAAELTGGVIDGDPEGDATWTTDTAANIIGAVDNGVVGTSFKCVLVNSSTSGSGEVVTLAGGTGVTLVGQTLHLTEGQNEVVEILFRLTNVTSGTEAVTGYVLSSYSST